MNIKTCLGLLVPLTLSALPVQADTWAWGRLEAFDRTEGVDLKQFLGNFSAGTRFGVADLWVNADYGRLNLDDFRLEHDNFDFGAF